MVNSETINENSAPEAQVEKTEIPDQTDQKVKTPHFFRRRYPKIAVLLLGASLLVGLGYLKNSATNSSQEKNARSQTEVQPNHQEDERTVAFPEDIQAQLDKLETEINPDNNLNYNVIDIVEGKIFFNLFNRSPLSTYERLGWYLLDPQTGKVETTPVPKEALAAWKIPSGWVYMTKSEAKYDKKGVMLEVPAALWKVSDTGEKAAIIEAFDRLTLLFKVKGNTLFYIDSGELFSMNLDDLTVTPHDLPYRQDDPYTAFNRLHSVSRDGRYVVVQATQRSEPGSPRICVIDTQSSAEGCVRQDNSIPALSALMTHDGTLYVSWRDTRGDKVVSVPDILSSPQGGDIEEFDVTPPIKDLINAIYFADNNESVFVEEFYNDLDDEKPPSSRVTTGDKSVVFTGRNVYANSKMIVFGWSSEVKDHEFHQIVLIAEDGQATLPTADLTIDDFPLSP